MKAHALWLDSHLRKAWHLQPGKAPLGMALKRSANWKRDRKQYALWELGE